MAGTYVFRLQAEGAEQVDREFSRVITAGKQLDSAVDALKTSSARSATSVDALTGSVGRSAAEATRASREIGRWTRELNAAAAATDELFAARQKAARLEEAMAGLQARGVAPTTDQAKAARLAQTEYEKLREGVDKTSRSIKLQAHEVTNLGYQLQDAAVQLAGGQNPFLILAQQGPQATGAVGGASRALALLTQTFTPGRLAAVAFAGGVAAVTAATVSQATELERMQTALRGVEGAYHGTAQAALAAARAVARSGIGVGVDDARAAQVSLASSAAGARIGGLDYGDLTRQAADLAARLGVDLTAALDKVGGAMRNPVALVDELRARGFPGMSESLRLTIQRLVEAGEPGAAFALLMGRIQENTRGAATEGTVLQSAMRSLKSELGSFWDEIKEGLAGPGERFLKWLADTARAKREYREAFARGDAIVFDERGGMTATPRAPGAPSTIPSTLDARLAMIRPVEGGTRDPYNNTQGNNRYLPNGIGLPIETMTVDQVREVMATMRRNGAVSMSVGAYQINRDTLDEFQPKLGIAGAALFDRATQDRIATAIIASVGDPNSPGYLGRLQGRFVGLRNVPQNDVYSTFGIGAGAMAGRPDFDRNIGDNGRRSVPLVAPPTAYDAALGIARGAPGSATLSGATPEARGASAVELIQKLREGVEAARADQPIDAIVQKIRELNVVVDQGQGGQALFIRGLTEQADAAQNLDPRLRAIAAAAQAYKEQMRTLGLPETEEGRAAAIAQRLRELGAAYLAAGDDAARSTAGQDRLSTAWGQGRDAVQRLAAEEKAREAVRAAGKAGTADEAALITTLADAYQALAQRQAENNQRATNTNARDNLAYLEKERELIGASADERERELAAFRARQQALASGVRNTALLDETQSLARAQVDATRRNTQLTNSTTALRDAFADVGQTIQQSLVSALASGEAKAVKLSNVLRAVQQGFLGKAIELVITNPLQNASDGGTRGTLMGALGGTGGGTSVLNRIAASSNSGFATSSAPSGASSGFSFGDVSSWGKGVSSLWDTARGWFGGGTNAASMTSLKGDAFGLDMSGGGAQTAMDASSAAGGSSFGSTLGGIGMGYAVGSTIGGLVAGAKNPAKQQNAQIGSAIGSIVGAYFGPVGSMVGGALGGALGGLFGPKGSFSGGVAKIGLNEDGQFTYAGASGKNWDEDGARRTTIDIVNNLNRSLRKAQVTVGGATSKPASTDIGDGTLLGSIQAAIANADIVAEEGFGKGGNSSEPALLAAIKTRGKTGSETADKVLRASKADTIDDLLADVDWARNVYEPLNKVGTAASEFQTSLDSALKPIDEAIKKTRELGLAEDVLQSKRKEATDAALAARDREVRGTETDIASRRKRASSTYSGADALAGFDTAATEEVRVLTERLKALGLAAEAAGGKFSTVVRLEETLAAERVIAARNAARADQDRAVSLSGAVFAVDQDTLNSTSRGDTAARLALANQGAQALTAVRRSLEDLGFSAPDVAARVAQAAGNLAIARDRLAEDQRLALADLNGGLVDRYQAAMETQNELGNQLARLERQHARERVELSRREGADLAQLTVTQAAEREALVRANLQQTRTEALQVGQSIRGFLDGLRTTNAGGRSPQEQLANATQLFERDRTLAAAGNAEAGQRISGTAQTLLDAASAMHGSGAAFASIRTYVENTLATLPQTLAYDAQTVGLLDKANAIALGVQGQQSALSVAQIASDNAIASSILSGLNTAMLAMGQQQIANDNAIAGAILGRLDAMGGILMGSSINLGSIVGRTTSAAAEAARAAVAVEAAIGAIRSVQSVLDAGTNPSLSLIYAGIVNLGQIVSAGYQGGSEGGGANTYGGNEGGGGGASGNGDGGGGGGGVGGGAGEAGGPGSSDGDAGGDGFAKGAAFYRGRVVPFARGTIVTEPTHFPMANGRVGLMGEAGEEGILPLGRDRAGRLGVHVADFGISSIPDGASIPSFQRDGGLIAEVRALRDEVRQLRAERQQSAGAGLSLQARTAAATEATAGRVDDLREEARSERFRSYR